MEDRAIERLTDLENYWMPFVDDATTYPIDCVFTSEELDTIDATVLILRTQSLSRKVCAEGRRPLR